MRTAESARTQPANPAITVDAISAIQKLSPASVRIALA